ncbi:DUF2510 domain-containing protein [Streptomyces sp. ISL-12]|uniref:DUF2510 domain-containing protein n=1 Tax=Streptomyces sp. ISL-12 TaxID=2819177 RepID=UPI001BE5A56B|nr:DUF2510 domain-containing protein [Streptomyces sp. ISL-12]MBT2415517.1 DUF2510 domain-containing protein [Streptomyces sp. ISL-12]
MTQETPPGWYPDPGQTSDGPATERWWDGKAWTDRIRPAGGPPEQPPTDGAHQAAEPEGPAGSAGSAGSAGPAGLAKPSVAGDAVAGQPDAAASNSAPGEPAPEEPASAEPGTAEPGTGQPTAADAGPGQPPVAGTATVPGQPPVAGPAPGYPAPPAYAAYPPHPGYPAQPPPPRRSGLRTGIAVAVTAAVLASIGVGVYALAGDGDGTGDDRAVSQQRSPGGQDGEGLPDNPFGDSGGGSGGGDGESPAPQGSEAPRIESGSVPDAVSGISLPVPDGWYGQELTVGAQVSSNESYECPGNSASSCTKGGAYSAPAMVLGTEGSTAEEVAKADISANAEESYGGDSYGSITSHDVLSSKAVTVAGQKGYQVRWKAVTSKGSDGYVQSLAFPSPANPQQIVVVRFGVDVSEEQSVIDEIVEGIEVSTSGGTGSGQDV